jgi:hypothetical protein
LLRPDPRRRHLAVPLLGAEKVDQEKYFVNRCVQSLTKRFRNAWRGAVACT